MKKVLLAGTALLGLAAVSSPAAAEVNLDLGGYFRGYGVYADNDEVGTAGVGDDLRQFDFRRDTEIHFSGETTTDNGLTLGFHYEQAIGGAVQTDEAYMYFSGGWGRVNFGSEDGAAYLLQVAAPSADSNVDGMRVYIQGLNSDLWGDQTLNATAGEIVGAPGSAEVLEYDHADFENTDRLTYLTPKWNGFQAGVSYAPEAGQNVVGNNIAGMATNDDAEDFEDLWEVAARWDGEFEGFGISLGAGYSHASNEFVAAAPAAGIVADDLETWNVGGNVTFGAFSLGAAYTESDTEIGDGAPAGNLDAENNTVVVGLGWDNGPYHLGASWLDRSYETQGTPDVDVERYTFGGGMTYGAGATFRGAVAFGDADDNNAGTTTDPDFVQVTVGTDVQF